MPRTIRLQSDSNAHDRPWRVAVEQGFFAATDLPEETSPGTRRRIAEVLGGEPRSDKW